MCDVDKWMSWRHRSGVLKIRRSALYVPASNARALAKSRLLDCDAIIVDLEDSIAAEEKAAARAAAVAAAREGGFGRRELIVRVNGLDTAWGSDDLAAVRNAGFDAVLAPKVSTPGEVERYGALLAPGVELWIMVETCQGVLRLDALTAARSVAPMTTLVMGTNDLAKEMRGAFTPARTWFLPFLSFAVAAARIHGLTVLDGVFDALDDPAGLMAACAQSVEFGCDGRTLVHPNQIAACNAAFTPTAEGVARASAIVTAFEQPGSASKGVLRVGGLMVERLHLDNARRVLELARCCVDRTVP